MENRQVRAYASSSMANIGKRIRRIMEEQDITVELLEMRSGVQADVISDYIADYGPTRISFCDISRIAVALGTNTNTLLANSADIKY